MTGFHDRHGLGSHRFIDLSIVLTDVLCAGTSKAAEAMTRRSG